jgi:hypothetical protein
MAQHNTPPSKRTWIIIVLIVIFLIAVFYFFNLNRKTELEGSASPDTTESVSLPPPCFEDLEGRDSSQFIKLEVKYTSSKFSSLDISSLEFDGDEFADHCLTKNAEGDAYIMSAYVAIGDTATTFPISSTVSADVKPFDYTLAITAISTKGDTLLKFSKEKKLTLSHTYDTITSTIKIKR